MKAALVSCDSDSWTTWILQEMHSVDCSCRDSVKRYTVCIHKACSTIWLVHLMISYVLWRPVLPSSLKIKIRIISMSFAIICAMPLTFEHSLFHFFLTSLHLNREKLEHLRWNIAVPASWSTSKQRWISQGRCWVHLGENSKSEPNRMRIS